MLLVALFLYALGVLLFAMTVIMVGDPHRQRSPKWGRISAVSLLWPLVTPLIALLATLKGLRS